MRMAPVRWGEGGLAPTSPRCEKGSGRCALLVSRLLEVSEEVPAGGELRHDVEDVALDKGLEEGDDVRARDRRQHADLVDRLRAVLCPHPACVDLFDRVVLAVGIARRLREEEGEARWESGRTGRTPGGLAGSRRRRELKGLGWLRSQPRAAGVGGSCFWPRPDRTAGGDRDWLH